MILQLPEQIQKKYPLIQSITNENHWNGLYQQHLPFDNPWTPTRSGSHPKHPMQHLTQFDSKHGTMYSFLSDYEMKHAHLKHIEDKDPDLSKQLHNHYWKHIEFNENSDFVLFASIKRASDVTV